MKAIVVGASGATGKLVVEQLLNKDVNVSVIVRSQNSLPAHITNHKNLSTIQANVHELTPSEIASYIKGCDIVISCLGHNLTFKGIFGQPRLLVTDTVRRFCNAIQANQEEKVVKFILMNTAGNSNRNIPEKVPLSQRFVIALIRLLIPPHLDNEKAADFLCTNIGQNNQAVEWVVVRPDGLTNDDRVTKYNVYPSPIRNVIFDAGQTSRINVAHFMTELVTDNTLWKKWQGQMPVLYNKM